MIKLIQGVVLKQQVRVNGRVLTQGEELDKKIFHLKTQ